jgi:hypothetical protein
MRRHLATALGLLALALTTWGCGKASPSVPGGGPLRRLAPVEAQGAISVTTRNTTRLGGADTTVDAASVARAVYPGLTAGSRPQAVVLVDRADWEGALAASALASAPLNAPILYTEATSMPSVTLAALKAMHPTGAATLGGAMVIRVGTSVTLPAPYAAHVLDVRNAPPAAMTAELESLLARAQGTTPHVALVLDAQAPAAMQMPAAGLAAESGAPILVSDSSSLPPSSAAVLAMMHKPSIYVLGAAGMSTAALGALARLGSVTRIPGPSPGEEQNAAGNSIAVARYTDGVFGWGVKEPGHGLVFANSGRPLDAPAAALLSATGEYGPLLLLEAPGAVSTGLANYLSDIQPAYSSAPEFSAVKGVYNHGWLIGDEGAISLVTQARLDSMLEISPRKQGSSEEPSASPE